MTPVAGESSKRAITEILSYADINISGKRPWDIQVHRPEFYDHILCGGSLALGETYMEGWWDCESLDQFFFHLIKNNIHKKIKKSRSLMLCGLKSLLTNRQTRRRALVVGRKHYDVGNSLFELMLDKHMTYSCAYWDGTDALTEAQEAKLELICRKIKLKPGNRVLDIGCGWGSFVRYAATKYNIEAVGLTISRNQADLARQRCAGLPIDIRLLDYRDAQGDFDAIVSIGMFEHVGYKNYAKFMQTASRRLKPGGLFLLHTIASNFSKRHCDPWFDKYIFPNGMLPSISQIGAACENFFIMEDWQNIGAHYDKTLMAWFKNFNDNWQRIQESYGEIFYRMWKYYLLSLAGVFRARELQVWQIVFSKDGQPGGYKSIR